MFLLDKLSWSTFLECARAYVECLQPIPPEISLDMAGLAGLLSVDIYTIYNCGAKLGDTCAIVGVRIS